MKVWSTLPDRAAACRERSIKHTIPLMRFASPAMPFLPVLLLGFLATGCSSGSNGDAGPADEMDVADRTDFEVIVVEVLWDVDQDPGDDSGENPVDPGTKTEDVGGVEDINGDKAEDPCPCGEDLQVPDSQEKDDGPGIEDVEEVDQGPCVPNCEGKVCGSDGCDGICGFCGWGDVCTPDGTACKTICIPDCIEKGKLCGDDGCVPPGSCGECEENFECKDDFKCHYIDCIPECSGKECGATGGCGVTNECGECGVGQSCTELGHCVMGPCQGVHPEKGKCDGNFALYCTQVGGQDVLIKIDCTDEPDKVCGWDPWAGKFACVDEPPCVPNCAEKECGDDGCKGSCGSCPVGWGCPSFKCRPVEGASCGYIEEKGYCWYDNWLYYCTGPADTGQIVAENCTQQSKVCAYDSDYTHTFQCMNPL